MAMAVKKRVRLETASGATKEPSAALLASTNESIAIALRTRATPLSAHGHGALLRALRLAEHWSSIARTLARRDSSRLATHVDVAWQSLDAVKSIQRSFAFTLLNALRSTVGKKDRRRLVRDVLDGRFPDFPISDQDIDLLIAAWPRRAHWRTLLTLCNRLATTQLGASEEEMRSQFNNWRKRPKP